MSKHFTWNERVRVTVGEMSRAQQLDYAKDVGAFLDDETGFQDYTAYCDELMIVHSPCRVEVCADGQWQTVTTPLTIGENFEAVTLAPALDDRAVRALPTSLFALWNQAALDANPYIRTLFLSATQSLMSTLPPSAAPSDGAASSAPESPTSPATKTTGSRATPKTSSAGS